MSVNLIIFIIIQLIAFIYFLEAMRRIRQRSKEYPLQDTRATLPFGFIRLRHAVTFYMFFYALWVVVSFWLYFHWIGGTSPEILPRPSETILNL